MKQCKNSSKESRVRQVWNRMRHTKPCTTLTLAARKSILNMSSKKCSNTCMNCKVVTQSTDKNMSTIQMVRTYSLNGGQIYVYQGAIMPWVIKMVVLRAELKTAFMRRMPKWLPSGGPITFRITCLYSTHRDLCIQAWSMLITLVLGPSTCFSGFEHRYHIALPLRLQH